MDQFVADVTELQRRTAMASLISAEGSSSSSSSSAAPPKYTSVARWELASATSDGSGGGLVVLNRLDSRDGFSLHCRVPPQYPNTHPSAAVVYFYRSAARDPFDFAARRRRKAAAEAAAKELRAAAVARKQQRRAAWEQKRGGSEGGNNSSSSFDSYTSSSDFDSDAEDFSASAVASSLSAALAGRVYDHVPALLDRFYGGRAFSDAVLKGYPKEGANAIAAAGAEADARGEGLDNSLPHGDTQTRRPPAAAAAKKRPIARRPQPSVPAPAAPLPTAGLTEEQRQQAGWLPSLDTDAYDYSHIYKDAPSAAAAASGGARGGGGARAAAASASSSAAAAAPADSRDNDDDGTFVSAPQKKATTAAVTGIVGGTAGTSASSSSGGRGGAAATALSPVVLRHLRDIESLCHNDYTDGDAFGGGGGGRGQAISEAGGGDERPPANGMPTALVSHDTARERFIVDVGVGLGFLPPLRCRALGLDRGSLLVARLAFPATGANASSYWSGHEAVRVERSFLCRPEHFGRPNAAEESAAAKAAEVASAGGGGEDGGQRQQPSTTATAPSGATSASHTAPVPWYARNRLQDCIARNQLAMQRMAVAEQRARVAAMGLVSDASSPTNTTATGGGIGGVKGGGSVGGGGGADGVDQLFKAPEERFFDTATRAETTTGGAGSFGGGSSSRGLLNSIGDTNDEDDAWGNAARPRPPPALRGGLLAAVQRCLLYLVRRCTSVCLVCDDALGYAGSKVGICPKPLCQHTSQRFGISTDLVAELTASGGVCELLLNLTRCAASVGGTRDTFEPMCPVNITEELAAAAAAAGVGRGGASPTPTLYQQGASPTSPVRGDGFGTASLSPTEPQRAHFYVDGFGTSAKDFGLIGSTIDSIPPIAELIANCGGSAARLREYLQRAAGPLAYPLLRWVIASNHAHLEPVPQEHLIAGVGTVHQFYLISSNPDKERRFREARRRAERTNADGVGTFYAWHGSGAGNWHCILRLGLRNYSGTKLMSTGQVYGAGVYFAKTLATSLPYMGPPQKGWSNSAKIAWQQTTPEQVAAAAASGAKLQKGLHVISLCEVVKAASGWKDFDTGIVTVQDEDLIATRFLFVYPNGPPPATSIGRIHVPTGMFSD